MAGASEALGLILRSACADAEEDAVAEDIAAMRGLAEAILADVRRPRIAARRSRRA
jgi:ribonuclease G